MEDFEHLMSAMGMLEAIVQNNWQEIRMHEKRMKTKMDANQERMEAKMVAQHKRMMARMDSQLQKMDTTLTVIPERLNKMDTTELEAIAEQ